MDSNPTERPQINYVWMIAKGKIIRATIAYDDHTWAYSLQSPEDEWNHIEARRAKHRAMGRIKAQKFPFYKDSIPKLLGNPSRAEKWFAIRDAFVRKLQKREIFFDETGNRRGIPDWVRRAKVIYKRDSRVV